MLDIENLGLLGVFIAGAIPWMEAIAVVPAGILVGLDPIATVIAASLGNAITILDINSGNCKYVFVGDTYCHRHGGL